MYTATQQRINTLNMEIKAGQKFRCGDLVIPIKSKTHPWKPIPVFRIHDVVLNDDNTFEYKAFLEESTHKGCFGVTSFKEDEIEAYTPKEYYKEDEDFSFQDIADGNEAEGLGYREFETGSRRDSDAGKPLVNHLSPYLRLRVGYHMRLGANKYGKANWRKGQPTEVALESLHRHLAKWEFNHENGIEQDECHLSACIFNIMLIMQNEQKEGVPADYYYEKLKSLKHG